MCGCVCKTLFNWQDFFLAERHIATLPPTVFCRMVAGKTEGDWGWVECIRLHRPSGGGQ